MARSFSIAWVTDIHLNFLDEAQVDAFCDALTARTPEAVLVGGDIAEADSVEGYLGRLGERLRRPVYFVLGNHDFYGGSIAAVRAGVDALARRSPWLRWLPTAGVVPLTERTALVGHDGWADARCGDYEHSHVLLNDHLLIADLAGLTRAGLRARLEALGDEAAAHFRSVLPLALERFENVLVLTHVPPFRDACWHEGEISNDDWLPHFTCQAVGEVLAGAMRARPDRAMTVLCGHTHSQGSATILPNLLVHTGRARYGRPEVQPAMTVP